MISDEQVRSSPPFLHRGLFPVIHKIGADVVPVEPFIPAFSGRRTDRLAAVTEKYAGFHYLSTYRDMSYVCP